jgi:DNA polymerase-3 subunit epsilon
VKARAANFTVLDFESTGAVRGHPEEPWQVGMVEVRHGRLTGRHFEQYLRIASTRPFNPYAPGRHAELRHVLAQAPSCGEAWPAWKPWVENHLLAAHNAGTERKFLQQAAPLHRFGPWVDTLKLSRRFLPEAGEYGLEAVCRSLGLMTRLETLCPGRSWHDALFDAYAAALVLEVVLTVEGWAEISVEDLCAIR